MYEKKVVISPPNLSSPLTMIPTLVHRASASSMEWVVKMAPRLSCHVHGRKKLVSHLVKIAFPVVVYLP